MYDIRGLRFEYPARGSAPDRGFRMLLDEFHLGPGEKLAVVGPNGSGKTTLLRILAFLEMPSACERFLFKGEEVGRGILSGRGATASPRGSIGFLRQHPWIFRGTVAENLAYPLKARGYRRDEIAKRVGWMCERLHLEVHVSANPRALSGGEQKRVALGRVLIAEPEVLLLDEPMAHLDKSSQKIIAEILAGTRTCAVFATHDLHLALGIADRTVTLMDGSLNPSFLENVFAGRCENGTFVTRRGLEIHLAPGGARSAGFVSVGPDAIRVLTGQDPNGAVNVFPGRVSGVRAQGETVWLEVEAGETFAVALSRSSYEEMQLNLYGEVAIQFSAEDVQVL